jgi:hypothetical protein
MFAYGTQIFLCNAFLALYNVYLEVDEMNAVGGPEVVRAVESEEEEVGEEKERHTANVHVQQQVPGKYVLVTKM